MWTDDIANWASALWKRGLTATEIGEKVGKTRNAVLGKLNRMGLLADGSHQRGVSNATLISRRIKARLKADAPPTRIPTPRRSAAREAGSAAPLAAPPLVLLKPSPDAWIGVVAAVEALQYGFCRWPLPDGPVAVTGFCMASCGSRDAYCTYHALKAFRPAGSPPEPDDHDAERPRRRWKF